MIFSGQVAEILILRSGISLFPKELYLCRPFPLSGAVPFMDEREKKLAQEVFIGKTIPYPSGAYCCGSIQPDYLEATRRMNEESKKQLI